MMTSLRLLLRQAKASANDKTRNFTNNNTKSEADASFTRHSVILKDHLESKMRPCAGRSTIISTGPPFNDDVPSDDLEQGIDSHNFKDKIALKDLQHVKVRAGDEQGTIVTLSMLTACLCRRGEAFAYMRVQT